MKVNNRLEVGGKYMYLDVINRVSFWGVEGVIVRVRVIGKEEEKRKKRVWIVGDNCWFVIMFYCIIEIRNSCRWG